MGLIGGRIGYLFLKKLCGTVQNKSEENTARDDNKTENSLKMHFGEDFSHEIREKIVIDFGCGPGYEAVQMARWGAKKVIGIDIQDRFIESAKAYAKDRGVECEFAKSYGGLADIVISKDSFEHFSDPEMVLNNIYDLLRPSGYLFISFGPPWLHPLGGHLFSVFPWAHLIFTEKALIRWRSDFKDDGASKFSEVEGGLNKMTINRFVKLIKKSRFSISSFETIPIKKLSFIHCRLSREFTTSIIKCKLIK